MTPSLFPAPEKELVCISLVKVQVGKSEKVAQALGIAGYSLDAYINTKYKNVNIIG